MKDGSIIEQGSHDELMAKGQILSESVQQSVRKSNRIILCITKPVRTAGFMPAALTGFLFGFYLFN